MSSARENSILLLSKALTGNSVGGIPYTEAEDNAFTTMLVLTSLRHLTYINKILKSLITKKLSKQDEIARYALVLGAAEILYMHTPDYAVINSYVELVKSKTNKYLAGFVNAVLRKICTQKEEFQKNDGGEFFSQKFRELLRRDYSVKTVAASEKISSQEPLLDITCGNTYQEGTLDGVKLPLGSIRLDCKGKISSLPAYDKGSWWVQDFSSSLPVKMLGNIAGKSVLELCAAPGGKTAQLLSGGAIVSCLDISKERLATLQENLTRLKLSPKEIICSDGVDYLQTTDQKFDIILLDAPCSATGTLRRHPEIVHTKSISDIEKQSKTQQNLLQHIDKALKTNGVFLYCTCSLCKDEGEKQIHSFLQQHKNYKIINLTPQIPAELSAILTSEGFIRVLPHHLAQFGGADGFFIACLQKGN